MIPNKKRMIQMWPEALWTSFLLLLVSVYAILATIFAIPILLIMPYGKMRDRFAKIVSKIDLPKGM